MKNFIFLSLFLFLLSCNKEEIKPNETSVSVDVSTEESLNLNGDWLLVDGKLFVENIETGDKEIYHHFGANKNVSSLRFDGYLFSIERIVKDSTVWSFRLPNGIPNIGEFILDYDSLRPMGLNVTKSNITIIEHPLAMYTGQQLSGSARPLEFVTKNIHDKLIYIYVQEGYYSNHGYNYKSFNELVFKKIK